MSSQSFNENSVLPNEIEGLCAQMDTFTLDFPIDALEAITSTVSVGEIANLSQFYEKIERERQDGENGQKSSELLSCLNNLLCSSFEFHNAFQKWNDEAEMTVKKYSNVETKVSEIHRSCKTLITEEKRLRGFADDLARGLRPFERHTILDSAVHSEGALQTLKEISEGVSFMQNHPNYREAPAYLLKYQQTESSALTIIKFNIVELLKSLTIQAKSLTEEFSPDECLSESSPLFNTFSSAAVKIRTMASEIEKRVSNRSYSQLLSDCHHTFFLQRKTCLSYPLSSVLEEVAHKSVSQSCRKAFFILSRIIEIENELYSSYFSTETPLLEAHCQQFCTQALAALRPIIIRCADIDELCSAVNELKERTTNNPLIQQFLNNIQSETQERLIFVSIQYIKNEIANYSPKDSDLDYPKKTVSQTNDLSSLTAGWYLPVENCLRILSKLNLAVNETVFSSIAHEALLACVNRIENGAQRIRSKKGEMSSALFFLSQSLVLREQIIPFGSNFSETQEFLDFSHSITDVKDVFSGTKGFSPFTVLNIFTPKVNTSKLDAKQLLEQDIKTAAEILTRLLSEQMFSPFTKFIEVFAKASAEPNLEAPFDALKEAENAAKAFEENSEILISEFAENIHVYLRNKSTESALLLQSCERLSTLFTQLLSECEQINPKVSALLAKLVITKELLDEMFSKYIHNKK